jgi:peptide chain release factor 1
VRFYTPAPAAESIPPALLQRARAIAVDHEQLTNRLSEGFDARAAKKVGEYSSVLGALQNWDKANEVRCRPALTLEYCTF